MINQLSSRISDRLNRQPKLKKFRFFMIAFILSNLGLIVGQAVPDFFPGKNNPWNTITSYVTMAALYLFLIIRLQLKTLKLFRLPYFDWRTWVALAVAVFLATQRINLHNLSNQSLGAIATGAVFILAIGLGEEVVSRGFVYGIFETMGKKFALFFSSLLFGLLHLSWYIGAYWDPWAAYWHVFNAFAAGFFLCSFMLATQSIWPSVLMHAAWDWRLGFNSNSVKLPQPGHITHSEFWSGLISPLWNNFPLLFLSIWFLFLRYWKTPRNFENLLLKFKLIEPN